MLQIGIAQFVVFVLLCVRRAIHFNDESCSGAVETDDEAGPDDDSAESSDTAETMESESDDVIVPDGDGYMFLIRGDGAFAILRARQRNLTPLVNWTSSDLINQGPGRNELRAVCMGDYFALYINGEFAGDATDQTYESGQVGLAASAYNRLGAHIEFDNLVVHGATAG